MTKVSQGKIILRRFRRARNFLVDDKFLILKNAQFFYEIVGKFGKASKWYQ